MTHMHQVAVRAVANQLINMLTNNILEDNGTESFEGWCEDGEVFNDHPSYKEECVALMIMRSGIHPGAVQRKTLTP